MYIISYIIVASVQFDSKLITNTYYFVLWNWTKITLVMICYGNTYKQEIRMTISKVSSILPEVRSTRNHCITNMYRLGSMYCLYGWCKFRELIRLSDNLIWLNNYWFNWTSNVVIKLSWYDYDYFKNWQLYWHRLMSASHLKKL